MVLAFGFYTNFLVFVNVQEKYPNTNILPPTGTAGMSQVELDDRVYGSKVTFVLEESMVMTQFLCKTCMCLVYYKLTAGLKSKQIWVHFVLGYVVLGWSITEIFFFAIWCRPFIDYFRVFDGNAPSCTTAQHHLIMSYTFNISSDLLILIVPVPLIVRSQLPWKRKAIIIAIFSFGIFVIISATLSRYYTFDKPDSILWIFWYVREASTIVIVANIPHLYALLRQIFHIDAFGSLVQNTKSRFGYGQHTQDSANADLRQTENGTLRSSGKTVTRADSTDEMAAMEEMLQIWQRDYCDARGYEAADEQWMGSSLGGGRIKTSVLSSVNRVKSASA
ncbi:hypothetical protein DV736_g3789, partial [Chaetothyriales sp. CBS 134916]